jgi:hypothetical protein
MTAGKAGAPYPSQTPLAKHSLSEPPPYHEEGKYRVSARLMTSQMEETRYSPTRL